MDFLLVKLPLNNLNFIANPSNSGFSSWYTFIFWNSFDKANKFKSSSSNMSSLSFSLNSEIVL